MLSVPPFPPFVCKSASASQPGTLPERAPLLPVSMQVSQPLGCRVVEFHHNAPSDVWPGITGS
jgi:hypothetical protein